jgi:hypothetical protein
VSEEPPAERAGDGIDDPTEAERRRRRRAQVFGDVLPESTRDERGNEGEGRRGESDAGEEWLRRQVPPHHGG